MNATKRNEELLREASAYGDEESIRALIEAGADINSQHNLNGWTALHWAAKRGHSSVVKYLLSNGADPNLKSLYGESAFAVAKNDEIRELLSGSSENVESQNKTPLPITPNYLANPPLAAKIQLPEFKNTQTSSTSPSSISNRNTMSCEEELVLKVRTSDPPDQDFIEIEVPLKNLTYENVFKICCEELQISPQYVQKLRKLPNTIVRKDKDVLRFQNFQELELVMIGSSRSIADAAKTYNNSVARLQINGYDRNSFDNSSPLVSKSNYCKNGTVMQFM